MVPRIGSKWDWEPWEKILTDGRMEAGAGEEMTILVTNENLLGVTRQMHWDKYSECPVVQISGEQRSSEIVKFHEMAGTLIDSLKRSGIEYEVLWGIVPCWG